MTGLTITAPAGDRLLTGPPRLSSDLDALLHAGRWSPMSRIRRILRPQVAGVWTGDAGAVIPATKPQEIYLEVWRNASEFDSAKVPALAWRPWPTGSTSPLRASRQ